MRKQHTPWSAQVWRVWGAGSKNKLLKPFSVTKHPTQARRSTPQQESTGVQGPSAQGEALPGGLRPGTAGARTWEPARLLSGGFVFSLKPLGHQVEKPLGAR